MKTTEVRRRIHALGFAALLCSASALHGQTRDTLPGSGILTRLPLVGSPAEDRARLGQLLGRGTTDGFLIRSPSSRLGALEGSGPVRWSLFAPQVDAGWNSTLPFSLNQGALWSGKGSSAQVTLGGRVEAGPVSLVLAPQLTYAENQDFQTIAPGDLGMSAFAAPWYVGRHSADVPLRFGNRPLVLLHPGQSTLAYTTHRVVAGVSTESQWWGPGIRNAIVMSSNAEGFPHFFLRTESPVRTRFGALEGKLIVGGLSESLFFDTVSTNDVRSLSGFVATFRPAAAPGMTVGVSRVVYAAVDRAGQVPTHAFDVLTRWDHPQPPVRAVAPGDSTGRDSVLVWPDAPQREQLFSVFGRWVLPADGVEVYAEWARTELPSSLVDMLNQPNHTQGYTLGLQWAKPVRRDDLLRLQTEVTYLEESTTFNNRPVQGYYVSATIPQGYTNRGKVIGAAIGPGASSQWIAGDYVARGWQLGVFGGRVRWNDDVYYDKPGRSYVAHDVSVFGGVRGGVRVWRVDAEVEYGGERRYNYLFQNPEVEPDGKFAVDKWNRSLRLVLSPR
ncbi:MAG: hypothetical protein JO040_10730 [Gemmatimonadetes bacterium]|nr:hypothetical protein [Gemmatimonadota bacterium]